MLSSREYIIGIRWESYCKTYVYAKQYNITLLNTCRLLNVKDLVDRLHCNVCLLEYRGYGHSDGTPSEEGIYMDAQAAIDYLTKTYQRSNVIDPQKVGGNVRATG